MLCEFQVYSKVKQLCIDTYPLFFSNESFLIMQPVSSSLHHPVVYMFIVTGTHLFV